MSKKLIKILPYLFLAILGGSSYFFDMPLFPLIIMMGIALYAIYKIFAIINLSSHRIIILEDGIEYRGIKYHKDNHHFYYTEFIQKFLGFLPIQEDYFFYVTDEEENVVLKINCLLYEQAERDNLLRYTKN